jgi:hypothetical protein
VRETNAYLAEATSGLDDRVLDRDKRIDLPGGRLKWTAMLISQALDRPAAYAG